MRELSSELALLKEQQLYRQLSTFPIEEAKNERWRNFASNDYLGLARHPRLQAAAHRAIERYGVGSGSSRLITGTSPAHEELETTLAALKETQAALSFTSGFATATGTIPALCGKDDTILLDKLSHACLIDAARFSGARLRVFPHNDLNRLESLLQKESARLGPEGRLLVVVESVYSMDGDVAPLREVVELKERFGAMLLVDEAHALGVLGPRGLGLAEALGLQGRIELQMGTLGKAAGGAGGYVACTTELRELFINKARSFIYSTAPPPVQCAVATEALALISSQEGDQRRSRLAENQAVMKQSGLFSSHQTAIFPYLLGESQKALRWSEKLREKRYLVPAIRYPTVRRGAARLRISLSAQHQLEEVRDLCALLLQFSSEGGCCGEASSGAEGGLLSGREGSS